MRIFLSAGEPSGDIHAANLLHSLRAIDPGVTAAGFGGDRMRRAGYDLLYPLADHAIMGLSGIVRALPTMIRLRRVMVDWITANRPDAVVLIDYPGFHWWLAAAAKRAGVPVVSFVPPQVWAWATHRVAKVRKYFDHVLCSLPFEEAWYHERDVSQARYVGHPFFDELAKQRLDGEFVRDQRGRPGPVVALLPGSRHGELNRNLDTLVHAAKLVHATRPDARFLFACYKPGHKDWVERRLTGEGLPAVAHVGRTPEIMHLADACAAVSGSVGLELLHHGTPTVVVYRVNPLYRRISRTVLHIPHISIVNLLAGGELFPEYLTSHDPAADVARRLLHWLTDPAAAAGMQAELAALRERVGRPGACRTAAEVIAGLARSKREAA
ncbi:MAG TPA: lipid-A-disaccharide synthase [Gemmataceae bacterium]